MNMNQKKSVFLLYMIITFSAIMISCDIDNVPLEYRPEYEIVNFDDLLFYKYLYLNDGLMKVTIQNLPELNDSTFSLELESAFFQYQNYNQIFYTDSFYVGEVRIDNIKLNYSDTTKQYFFNDIYGKNSNAIPVFGKNSLWSYEGNEEKGFYPLDTTIYVPEILKVQGNFKNLDTISRNSDLVFNWIKDNNYTGKIAVLVETYNMPDIIDGDTIFYYFNQKMWHKVIEDSGSLIIPKGTILQLMDVGGKVKVTFGRGIENIIQVGYMNIYVSAFAKTSFIYNLKD